METNGNVSGSIKLAPGDAAFVEGQFSLFFTPREDDDINLVTIISLFLAKNVSNVAASLFETSPTINSVRETGSVGQRVIVNQYFRLLLARYRSRVEHAYVLHMLQSFFNEGDIEGWFQLFQNEICPFLKTNRVYEAVYGYQG